MIDTVVLFLRGLDIGIPAVEFEVVSSDEEVMVVTATFPGRSTPSAPAEPEIPGQASLERAIAEFDNSSDEETPEGIDYDELPDLDQVVVDDD